MRTRKHRVAAIAVAGLALSTGSVALSSAASAASAANNNCLNEGGTFSCYFGNSGTEQVFTVPTGVTSIRVAAYGASGSGFGAGQGAVVSGTLSVTPGQKLYVEAGTAGNESPAGWNGGGAAGQYGGGGGGASDVRTKSRNSTGSLQSRLLVAAGGGGAGNGFGVNGCTASGGNGGNATAKGGDGAACPTGAATGLGGGAGTASSAGAGGSGGTSGTAAGANGNGDLGGRGGGDYGGGGGGGWFGGGGGGDAVLFTGGGGGGGGGSNHVPAGGSASVGSQFNGQVLISYGGGVSVTGTPPAGGLHEPYAFTFTTTGPTPRTVRKAQGTLPPGLSLNTAGKLSGTPSKAGTYGFVVAIQTSAGTASEPVSMTIRPVPTVVVAGTSVTEGNTGTHALPFRVALSRSSKLAVTVHYATVNGSAKAPADFTAKSGTLTFKPGQTTATVNVAVKGDKTHEPNESFTLRLTNPANAQLGASSAPGTIVNDD